jgi:hypothetical protein
MNFYRFIPSTNAILRIPVHASERAKLIYSSKKLLKNCYQDIQFTSEKIRVHSDLSLM